jgi:hypothetical protein
MMTWHNRAACAGYQDPDAFVPKRHTEREQLRETITARSICAGCPVSDQCLTDAIKERDFYTVRGGTVPIARVPGRSNSDHYYQDQGRKRCGCGKVDSDLSTLPRP